MSHTLIVLPDDTAKPILDALAAAKRSLNIRMFLFTDPTLLEAVIARAPSRRQGARDAEPGAPQRRGGEQGIARDGSQTAGIEVRDSNPDFDLTHQKSMVIDDDDRLRRIAQLGDARPDRDARLRGRDDQRSTKWRRWSRASTPTGSGQNFDPHPKSRLIWCPNNGRERIAAFIDSAKHTLWLQNERYQDTVIIERLVRAANRGVSSCTSWRGRRTRSRWRSWSRASAGLRIMQRRRREDPQAQGAEAAREDDPRRRASARSSARSISRPGRFDARRELALDVDSHHVVERLDKVARHDWEHSTAIDLSDEGLRADLDKREGRARARTSSRSSRSPTANEEEEVATVAGGQAGSDTARPGARRASAQASRRSSHALPAPIPFDSASRRASARSIGVTAAAGTRAAARSIAACRLPQTRALRTATVDGRSTGDGVLRSAASACRSSPSCQSSSGSAFAFGFERAR